jgi:predicted nuclease of predicted toxin-antitoxin system
MRFLADMGISPMTVSYLLDSGHDAVHLHARRLDRLQDSSILAMARAEERVVLTHDLGFGELVAASRAHLPSVVIFRLRNMRPENVNHHLEEVIRLHSPTIDLTAPSAPAILAPLS